MTSCLVNMFPNKRKKNSILQLTFKRVFILNLNCRAGIFRIFPRMLLTILFLYLHQCINETISFYNFYRM